jgi:hypothetical protein
MQSESQRLEIANGHLTRRKEELEAQVGDAQTSFTIAPLQFMEPALWIAQLT